MSGLEVSSSIVEFPSNASSGKTGGFLVGPKAPGRYPGVIMIHEIWELVDNIKDISTRLAREGYVVLAIDLCEGKTLLKLEDGRKLREQISEESMLKAISAGYLYLKGVANVNTKKIGSIGFCMGGGLSLRFACITSDLSAAVVFYGRNPSPIDLVANIRCPILGNYAGEDRGISEADVKMLEDALKRHGKTFDFKIYSGAPHGFFNDTRESYRPEAAKDAWKRVLEFYEKYLKK
jgi:carboxymethylenebutenolidase